MQTARRLSLTSTLPAWLVVSVSVGCGTGAADTCTPGVQIACACDDGSDGAQVCTDDGLSFGECECGGTDTTDPNDTDVADTDAQDTDPGDTDVVVDCDTTAVFSGLVGTSDVTTGYLGASAWDYMGSTGLPAGNAMCEAKFPGSHVCDYEELVTANDRPSGVEAAFAAVAQGTTVWVHRTTSATVGGQASAPGPGGRCNDWTYSTNHLSDGEFGRFATAGALTFVLDNDTVFDPSNPGVHTLVDLQCGGESRAIPCCVTCTP